MVLLTFMAILNLPRSLRNCEEISEAVMSGRLENTQGLEAWQACMAPCKFACEMQPSGACSTTQCGNTWDNGLAHDTMTLCPLLPVGRWKIAAATLANNMRQTTWWNDQWWKGMSGGANLLHYCSRNGNVAVSNALSLHNTLPSICFDFEAVIIVAFIEHM